MASFIPANKCIRIVPTWSDEDGHTAQVRSFFTYTGTTPITAELVVVATDCWNSIAGNIQPAQHNTWSLQGVVATDLTTDTSPQGSFVGVSPGTLAGGRLPASTSMVVSNQTGRRYRGGHSRVYLPVGDDTKLLTDSTWTVAFVDAVGGDWNTVINDTAAGFWGAAGTVTHVMASFYAGFTNEVYGSPPKYRRVPTPRATAVFFPVTTLAAKQELATQRRRLRAG
jgi:hypothetical protein